MLRILNKCVHLWDIVILYEYKFILYVREWRIKCREWQIGPVNGPNLYIGGFMGKKDIKQWLEVAEALYSTKQQLKELSDKANMLAEQLKTLSKNKSTLYQDYKFVLQLRKGPVEYYKIPELKSIDLDAYRKDNVVTWKLDKIS